VSRRAIVAAAVLVLWGIGLGALVRRAYFRPDAERLALAGLHVAPGAAFYAVERGGRHVGFASTTVDTSAREIVVTDEVTTQDARRGGRRVRVRASVRLSRALLPLSFAYAVEDSAMPLALTARVRGDSALVLTVRSGASRGAPQTVPTAGRAYPPSAVPLLVALGGQLRVGGRLAVTLFDPTAMAARPVVLRVAAESLFTLSDSAGLDRAAGRWVSAHQDTVRAWHVRTEGDTTALDGWVDTYGRMVQARLPDGFLLRRTSFEEAAENWRRPTRGPRVSPAGAAAPAAAAIPADDSGGLRAHR
jgi:hypothetical protein